MNPSRLLKGEKKNLNLRLQSRPVWFSTLQECAQHSAMGSCHALSYRRVDATFPHLFLFFIFLMVDAIHPFLALLSSTRSGQHTGSDSHSLRDVQLLLHGDNASSLMSGKLSWDA